MVDWMDTTDAETFFSTVVQSVLVVLLLVLPEPDVFEDRPLSELVVGTFTQPLVMAAYPNPRHRTAATRAATTATTTLFAVLCTAGRPFGPTGGMAPGPCGRFGSCGPCGGNAGACGPLACGAFGASPFTGEPTGCWAFALSP